MPHHSRREEGSRHYAKECGAGGGSVLTSFIGFLSHKLTGESSQNLGPGLPVWYWTK